MGAQAKTPPEGAGRRILVVDDDPDIRRLLSMILAKAGYATAEAENGAAAQPLLLAEKFDAVLADLQMPVMDGIRFVTWLRSEAKLKTPVVVFTSSRSHQDVVKSYGLGAVCLITKPLGFHEFVESIKSTISNFLDRD